MVVANVSFVTACYCQNVFYRLNVLVILSSIYAELIFLMVLLLVVRSLPW